jgi:hypothetical protein
MAMSERHTLYPTHAQSIANDREVGMGGARSALEPEPVDSMTGEPDWGQLALDIHVAAQTKAPVLISAPADCAVNVARAIAAFASVWKAADVVVCDCACGDDLGAAVASARSGGDDTDTPILLLREVHALGEADQAAMARVFADPGDGRPHAAPRIISTSSVSLFDRVLEGAFDEQLFYRLNAMHIVIETGAGH